MHLIEPFLGKRPEYWGVHLASTVEKRKDIWASAEDAYQELKDQRIWQNWDERILKIYVVLVNQIYSQVDLTSCNRSMVFDRCLPRNILIGRMA